MRSAKRASRASSAGGIGAAVLGGKGVVVHQVPGEDPAVEAPPRMQPGPGQRQHDRPAQPPAQAGDPPQRPADERPGQRRGQQLRQQHDHRVKRRDHRPAAQPHQPHQRARADIGPGGADKLAIGRENALAHRTLHDVGPDQHLELGLGLPAGEIAGDAPAEARAVAARAEAQMIARDARLFRPLAPVKLAIAAGRDRVIARDVKDAAAKRAGHGKSAVCPRSIRDPRAQTS